MADPTATGPGAFERVRIGLVSVSDRASSGVYADQGIPALQGWLQRALRNPVDWETRLVADEEALVSAALRELVDERRCDLVLTTGGTGPAPRDVTPEATADVCEKMLPGFGEQMRAVSLAFVPTAILSRQTAGIRGRTLIVNLPGRPKSVRECLDAIFPAIPYCLDLIGAARLQTDPAVMPAFRPKGA